jgi:death on curing protein
VTETWPQPEHVEFLTEEDVYALIDAELGGRAVRDPGLLSAALARPRATVFGEDAYPGLAGKAAAVMHSLVTSHALVDGNKRVGLAAALLFYGLNGVRLTATDDELFALTMAIAEGREDDVESIAGQLVRWETPDRPGDSL